MCDCQKSSDLVIDPEPNGEVYWFFFCTHVHLWMLVAFTKAKEVA